MSMLCCVLYSTYNREEISKCVLYREVVLSSEVKVDLYNREETSKCVLYIEVVLSSEVKMYILV